MKKFPLQLIQDDGSLSSVDIQIKKITPAMAIPVFEARDLEIYDALCREIPLLQEQATAWKETLNDLCSFPGVNHNSDLVKDFINGYGNVELLIKSKAQELERVEAKIKTVVDGLPAELPPEMPEYIKPYMSIASQVCGSHLIVSGVTGEEFEPGGYFAKADPDSFYFLCCKIREVNARFLENSLFRTEEPNQGAQGPAE